MSLIVTGSHTALFQQPYLFYGSHFLVFFYSLGADGPISDRFGPWLEPAGNLLEVK